MSKPQVVDLLKRAQHDMDGAAIRAMRDASQLISTSRDLSKQIQQLEQRRSQGGYLNRSMDARR